MSYTATDCEIFASGLSGVSEYRCLLFGWLLMNSAPPPWPFSSATFLNAYSLWPFGSVPISEIVSSPRWPVDQTGPNFGWMKFAPRPGCGILPTSISAASLSSLVSITEILLLWLAATMK